MTSFGKLILPSDDEEIDFADLVYIAHLDSATSTTLASTHGFQGAQRSCLSRRLQPKTSASFFAIFARAGGVKLPHRRHLGRWPWGLCLRNLTSYIVTSDVADHCFIRGSAGGSSLSLRLRCRFRQKLFEVLKQVGSSVEKLRDLCINILYGFRLSLIGLQDVKELLVGLWLLNETILPKEK